MEEDLLKNNANVTVLRRAQLNMLDIVLEVDAICRKHNLKYFIDFGTLLGAVRHKGFIPWDDDLDICMLSEDYQKFVKIAATELSDKYFLQTKQTDPKATIGRNIARIRDNNSLYISSGDSFKKTYQRGVFIDIFELIPAPVMPKGLFRFVSHRVSYAYNFYIYNPELTFKNIIAYFVYPLSYIFFKGIWKLFPASKNSVTVSPECYIYGEPIQCEDIFPLQEVEFEDEKLYAPRNMDKRLRDIYNDYMQIPPPEKRRLHAIYILYDVEKPQCKFL